MQCEQPASPAQQESCHSLTAEAACVMSKTRWMAGVACNARPIKLLHRCAQSRNCMSLLPQQLTRLCMHTALRTVPTTYLTRTHWCSSKTRTVARCSPPAASRAIYRTGSCDLHDSQIESDVCLKDDLFMMSFSRLSPHSAGCSETATLKSWGHPILDVYSELLHGHSVQNIYWNHHSKTLPASAV